MDSNSDENSWFLVNISKYLLLFKRLDLDYFTIQTYALEQLAYNPVKQNIVSLFDKLVGIKLNAFIYSKHLRDVNRKVTVVNEDLEHHNYKHVGEHLCKL